MSLLPIKLRGSRTWLSEVLWRSEGHQVRELPLLWSPSTCVVSFDGSILYYITFISLSRFIEGNRPGPNNVVAALLLDREYHFLDLNWQGTSANIPHRFSARLGRVRHLTRGTGAKFIFAPGHCVVQKWQKGIAGLIKQNDAYWPCRAKKINLKGMELQQQLSHCDPIIY